MARIKLKQPRGEYGWNGYLFEAGKVYDVDDKTAFYLVNFEKVAEGVDGIEAVKPPSALHTSIDSLKIALVRIGGIGDCLELAGIATAVKRKFKDCHTTLFVRDTAGADIIRDNPAVDNVVIVGNAVWADYIQKIVNKDFDIVYDNRYVTKVFFKNPVPQALIEEKKKTDELFKEWQDYYVQFPQSSNRLSERFKGSHRKLTYQTANLIGDDEDLHIQLDRSDFNMLPLLEGGRYITIHNGADIARQTKCWVKSYWDEVVVDLRKRGYKVVQLGSKYEEVISGVIDMTGKTTLKQAASLISEAMFHIDTEGGLVHIARAVGTRSIVIFGPTPVMFFGYDCNINIVSAIKCRGCWWKTDMWWRACPERYSLPTKCMEDIKAGTVIQAVDRMEKEKPLQKKFDPEDINEKFAIELPLTEGHYKSEPHQWDRIYTMMSLVKGPNVLEVGAGDGYCVEVLKKRGLNVTAIEISQIRLERMKQKGIEAIYADINNLPFGDGQFDTVMCGEVLEHLDSMGQGLKELERVCKKDGKVIISIPIAPEYKTIKMHKWGVDLHLVSKNSKPEFMVLDMGRLKHG